MTRHQSEMAAWPIVVSELDDYVGLIDIIISISIMKGLLHSF